MILHILPDDKFIDMAYNMFEKASPGNNEFMIVTKAKKLNYVKTTSITKITKFEILSKKFANQLINYEFVVIHWMDILKLQLISNASDQTKFLWIGWGGDYYNYIDKELFLPKTKQIKKNIKSNVKTSLIVKLKTFIKTYYYNDTEKIATIINKIAYFAPVLSSEYPLMAKSFKHFTPKFLDWNYGTLESNLIGINDKSINGDNILVGNSATFENNHLEVFDILKNLNTKDRDIIVPLSYGDENYSKMILKDGTRFFNLNFKPITSFMELKKYNTIISTCSVVIMNHLRQQAVGNIIVMMYFGAKIFLNPESPVYKFYMEKGAVLFSVEELDDYSIATRLSKEEININREILQNTLSEEIMFKNTKELIKLMREHKN